MAETIKNILVKTRKPHQCYSCFRKFPQGTMLWYYAGLWEGDFCSMYYCGTCAEIMKKSKETEYTEGFVHEMLNKNETPEEFLLRM